MIVSKTDVDQMIKKAIHRFVGPYGEAETNIQVIFSLDKAGEKMRYMTCVNNQVKDSVTLRQLIGWNLYNGVVDDKITVLLQKIQQECPGAYVMTGIAIGAGKVYYYVRKGNGELIREMEATELLN